ncbi:SF1B family DNA helicase RecD2 [Anaerosacchariphilus polymeriproducens]|uniref:ATP-dependent RecD2 DNA helicase n=1 Tax=Anaerosacchariphilus polymeriproducens TaxID=1812858 RepID=A0A371AT40_9FIRM|nr:ATP-dependent RecD-like DNA helicase [Anaerosacchariphilus polymeriproducens]RDU22719.1 ATP-dependent RecD-like DNA helicase [Anaerosacchariphilus polymeriproducens]
METIAGFIEHIIYRNSENGYTVLNLINEDEEETTCVGVFQIISEGEFIEAQGSFGEHQMYGQQFQIEKYEIKAPEDEISIERYLASGAVKGIGAALAARIVRRFKADTFRIIENEPERLAEIKGISERKAREIAEQIEDKKELRQAMIFLQKYGITTNLAVKIYSTYGNEIYQVLKENPYRMADEIPGIGFKIADEIASKVGIHTDSDFRIKSGILYTLLQASTEGHTYLPYEELERRASEILEIAKEHLGNQIMNLAMERRIVIKELDGQKNVYAVQYYYLELNIAKMLHDLNVKYKVEEEEIEKRLEEIEEKSTIELDDMQRTAVKESVKNGLLIITGGPGTGKTTTINAMIKFFESEELDIFLAAPTGRAAKRMTEATGHEAKTIHRLLELSGGLAESGNRVSFEKNEENPLEADAIIIDEMSMVDIHLIHALLKAITIGTRVILVGDINQLPSVGPGSILKNLIQSQQFSVVMLKKIFRQASQSDIVVNAHKINDGQEVILDNKSKDFFFLKRNDANVIISILITLIQKKLPPYVNAKPYDIQVLTPMRKGLLGVERLNSILQEYLNPPSKSKKEKEIQGSKFREGDKVMQIKNNYQIEWEISNSYGLVLERGTGVFNGDMGVIKEINLYAELITVEYDEGRRVDYSFKQLDELELAYAITIHKSQGSEYPAVIIPLLNGPQMLMNRNLLYTAVTRAKSCVTLVGNDETFFKMISNTSEQTRYSGLKECILELKNS